MKRIFSILAVILILLTGCNNSTELSDTPTESTPAIVITETVTTPTTENEDPKGTTENADTASSFSASNETVTTEPEETMSKIKPTVTTEQPAQTEKKETASTTPAETKPSVMVTEPQKTKPAETQPVEQPQENIPEITTPTDNKTESTEEPAIELETQAPETTEMPKAFDIDYWIGFAKNYAQSKGLVLDAAAVDCWDTPIRAGSHCMYLERDIQSRLNRYANDEDITDVWIWAESVGNDCYDIYIGYA